MSRVRIPDGLDVLVPFVERGVLDAPDVHLAGWVARASGVDLPEVVLAVAFASWAARHGHSCADLDDVAAVMRREHAATIDAEGLSVEPLDWPSADVVLQALASAPTVARVATAPDPHPVLGPEPVVVHGRRVYLQRHWADECSIAASLRARAVSDPLTLSPSAATLLDRLLPVTVDGRPNLQRVAADAVMQNRLAVVVGGPGTGKTYTVSRILAVLVEQAQAEGRHLHIGLAAPTGKAAQRLRESIVQGLEVPPDVLATLQPRTIHGLLGSLGGTRERFRHDASMPLPHDVVVIDETSMVSAPLLARLLEAVRPDARLVLVGDPGQLESVDRGAVLADIVAGGSATGPLHGRVVQLLRAFRFGAESPIALLADAVRDGDAEAALRQLRAGGEGLTFVDTADPLSASVVEHVRDRVAPSLLRAREAAEQGDAAAAVAAIAEVRVLCGHREGRFGVATWNRLAETWMCGPAGAPGRWYAGRPVLVTANDVRLGLANGDIGVVVRDEGRLMVAFPGVDVRFDPVQLDAVDTAFAMTVHKSQGSEYATVVLVLPPDRSPLAGRELLYTGATRAKRELHVVGSAHAVTVAVHTPAHRMTGLASALS